MVISMRITPQVPVVEYLVSSWWNCLEGLGGVALLEKVCH